MALLRYIVILLSTCIMSLPAQAEETPTEALRQYLEPLSTLRAVFAETVTDSKGNSLQHSSGHLALQRPGKFRWQTRTPTQQLLIADGKKVWFYDIDLEQVTVQPQSKQEQNTPALLLSGSTQTLINAFRITRLPHRNDQGEWFQLKPKHKNLFQQVELHFVNHVLQGMTLTDHLGQISRLSFSKVEMNPSLSPRLFHFVAPKGVDIIQQAQ